jgi:hypothetical protein
MVSEPDGAPPARRGYWLPAAIALAVLLAIGAAIGAGDLDHSSPRYLSGADIDSQIALAVQLQLGTRTAPQLHCPASEPVRAGLAFACTATAAGHTETLRVVEIDSRGDLRWSENPGP